jgi:hypothetical protein
VTDDAVDTLALLAREVLLERRASLIAHSCAWAVGLSDRPHLARRSGRVVPTGVTLGARALAGLPLASDEDAPVELGETRPGTFADALGALAADGSLYADLFEAEALAPFVRETCAQALAVAGSRHPEELAELLDELGEDGSDPAAIARAAEWEPPLMIVAAELALAALSDQPLVEVESEGLPLSLVLAAEGITREAVADQRDAVPGEQELAGALFLAEAALRDAGLPDPVPPDEAEQVVDLLLGEGLEPVEVLAVLPHLPLQQDTAEEVAVILEARGI